MQHWQALTRSGVFREAKQGGVLLEGQDLVAVGLMGAPYLPAQHVCGVGQRKRVAACGHHVAHPSVAAGRTAYTFSDRSCPDVLLYIVVT